MKFLNYMDGNLRGNASTATKLEKPRKINGVDFDGSKDISLSMPQHNHDERYLLKNSKGKLSNKEDLNIVTEPGVYAVTGSKNAPTDAGKLIIYPWDHEKWVTQVYIANNNELYTRAARDGQAKTWSNWTKFSTTLHNHDGLYKSEKIMITPNSDGDKVNKWSKIGIIELKYQYADRNVWFTVTDFAHGTPTNRTGQFMWRVKQQDAVGQKPMHSILFNDIDGFNQQEFCSVIVRNDSKKTVAELWVKNSRNWSVIKCNILDEQGVSSDKVELCMEVPYQDGLPLGDKIYGSFTGQSASNFYAHRSGKCAHIGAGENDVYFHNTKCESYLQLRDDGTLTFNGNRVHDNTTICEGHYYQPCSGHRVERIKTELKAIHIGSMSIISWCMPGAGFNGNNTGNFQFKLPFGIKDWHSCTGNIYKILLNGKWTVDHWYKAQVGCAVSCNGSGLVNVNVQAWGTSGLDQYGATGVIIVERS